MLPADSILPISGNEGKRHSEYLVLRIYIEAALAAVNNRDDMSELQRTEALLPFMRVYSPSSETVTKIDVSESFSLPNLSERDLSFVAEGAIKLNACRNGNERPTTQKGIEQLCATLEGVINGEEQMPGSRTIDDARFTLEQMLGTADKMFRERYDTIYGWTQ